MSLVTAFTTSSLSFRICQPKEAVTVAEILVSRFTEIEMVYPPFVFCGE